MGLHHFVSCCLRAAATQIRLEFALQLASNALQVELENASKDCLQSLPFSPFAPSLSRFLVKQKNSFVI